MRRAMRAAGGSRFPASVGHAFDGAAGSSAAAGLCHSGQDAGAAGDRYGMGCGVGLGSRHGFNALRVWSAFGCGYVCDFAERGGLLLAQTEASRFAASEYLSQGRWASAPGVREGHKIRERPARGIGNSIALAAGQRSAGESGERGTVIVSRETAGPNRWLEACVAAAAESGR